jgi:tetratricopeptide (TPR) repeat protein
MDLNNLAWAELFRNPQGELAPTALERSRKSVTMGQSRGRAELHTLATIYATIGRFDEAHSILVRMIEMDQGVDPRPEDWYVYGLIAEGYGFHDAAEAAWRKVVRNEFSIPSKTDTYILAQARSNARSGLSRSDVRPGGAVHAKRNGVPFGTPR